MRRLLLFVISSALAVASTSAQDLPKKLKPVFVYTGIDSKQTKQSFTRCTSQKEWQARWQEHRGAEEKNDRCRCPEIDFDSFMVVVIFHGKSDCNDGLEIVSTVEEKDCVRVRFKPMWYQIAGRGDYDTQSYVFCVLPRSQKAIVFEEDVKSIIADPPKWKEQAKLPAVEKK
jgi:hypothetical protein